jgi:hypothetical protein
MHSKEKRKWVTKENEKFWVVHQIGRQEFPQELLAVNEKCEKMEPRRNDCGLST